MQTQNPLAEAFSRRMREAERHQRRDRRMAILGLIALAVALYSFTIWYAMEAWNYLARRHDFTVVGWIEVFFAEAVIGAAGTAWRGVSRLKSND